MQEDIMGHILTADEKTLIKNLLSQVRLVPTDPTAAKTVELIQGLLPKLE